MHDCASRSVCTLLLLEIVADLILLCSYSNFILFTTFGFAFWFGGVMVKQGARPHVSCPCRLDSKLEQPELRYESRIESCVLLAAQGI